MNAWYFPKTINTSNKAEIDHARLFKNHVLQSTAIFVKHVDRLGLYGEMIFHKVGYSDIAFKFAIVSHHSMANDLMAVLNIEASSSHTSS